MTNQRQPSETKMVIVMRKDLNMTKGKYVAQGSHAAVAVVRQIEHGNDEAQKKMLEKWLNDSYVKVCVYVKSLEDLEEIYEKAKENHLAVSYITDNGLTMFNGIKTDTCLAVLGYREDVDIVTGHLPLL